MKAVCPVIASEQVTRRRPGHGGTILVQIENEYDLYREIPARERGPHLRALYEAALAGGIEVPIFTCWTRQCRDSADSELGRVFDAVNSYPRFDIDILREHIRALQAAQPDAPVMISELQGGWFGKVGGLLSENQPGLSPEQLNAHTLLAIQEGATLLNYYMICGGTNFGLSAARDMTTTYDYDAPIRESGGVGAKYRAVVALGRMLRVHGAALARSRTFPCQAETGSPDVAIAARRDRAGGIYIFLRNRSLTSGRRGSAVVWLERRGESRIDYDLGPLGSRILYLPPHENDPSRGEWMPRPEPEAARPARIPNAVRPLFSQTRTDPGPTGAVPAPAGTLLPELGVYDSRTVVYSTRVSLPSPLAAPIDALRLEPYPGDPVTVEVNGHILAGGREVAVGAWLHAGDNSVRVLYLQAGQANVGAGIQDRAGLRSVELGSSGSDSNPGSRLQSWELNRELGGIAAGWPLLPPGEIPGWTQVSLDRTRPLLKRGTLADAPEGPLDALAVWHRVEFELPVPDPRIWIPWHARIDASGDGLIFSQRPGPRTVLGAGPAAGILSSGILARFWPGPEKPAHPLPQPGGQGGSASRGRSRALRGPGRIPVTLNRGPQAPGRPR